MSKRAPARCSVWMTAAVMVVASVTLAIGQGAGQTSRGTPQKPPPKAPATPPATRPAPPPDAHAIVTEAQKRATVDSQHYEGLLRVTDAGGKVSEKRWIYERFGSHGTSKTIIRFTDPAEVKGVAVLVFNHPDRESDQWMWTPALNRDRRIASQDRRTRFFGTDFSFEDLEERDAERYAYTLGRDEAIEGAPCWRIESTPKSGVRSQYTRSTLWIRKSDYTYAQIDNFTGSTLVRRLNYRDVAVVQGIATPRAIEVRDLARNSRTSLKLDALKYNLPLKESQFTLEALRRG